MSTSLTPHSGTHAKREVRSDTGIGLETRAYTGRVLGLGRENHRCGWSNNPLNNAVAP